MVSLVLVLLIAVPALAQDVSFRSLDLRDYPALGATKEQVIKIYGSPTTATGDKFEYHIRGGPGAAMSFKDNKMVSLEIVWIRLDLAEASRMITAIYKNFSEAYGPPEITSGKRSFGVSTGSSHVLCMLMSESDSEGFSVVFGRRARAT